MVKDHANSNKTADNGKKVHVPFSTIIIQEIQMEEIIIKEVEVVKVGAAVEGGIDKEIINKEIKTFDHKEDGETTITAITTITYQIIITTKEEWEEHPTRTTLIITTREIILQTTLNPINLIFKNQRIIHRIISRCNFVNFIKLTNAQIRNVKDFMDLQKVI